MADKIEPECSSASYTVKNESFGFFEKYAHLSIPKMLGLLNLQTHEEVYFWLFKSNSVLLFR